MSTETSHSSLSPRQKYPQRFFLSLLHLLALGSIGSAILLTLLTLGAVGLSLVPLLGIGLFFLLGVFYAFFGLAWLEIERISSLYDIPAKPLRWRKRSSPGFGGYVRSLGSNFVHGRMWAALGNLAISVILGSLVIGSTRWFVNFILLGFSSQDTTNHIRFPFGLSIPASYSPYLFIGALVCIALIIGLVYLHRAISVGVIGSITRESELTERVRSTTVQRQGAVRAAELERSRIERDLHDGVQPRLVSVGITLGLANQQIDSDPQKAKELVQEAHASTKSAITELRQLTRGIYASVLEDRGLDAALSAIASRSHLPVQLDTSLPYRFDKASEAAIYFSIAEALNNATKHSRATECRVTVRTREEDGREIIWARVEDNGIGGAEISPGGGLDGINNRVLALGGELKVVSPAGGPTAIEVTVPCES